ncbi:hypothetical protein GCM10010508_16030 [Streptomyces naganishii JCM 4654]|uniref:Uncharacterized protein n=1 Tax=Streptomyces naganishii JCM 4654 TaxID=1306179 RepID=A0A919CU22_9ACTN|nr:hypothetical protein GCM10010508_16030 [Streptomyces naganishii JCM 4654]
MVTQPGLGTLNITQLTAEALRARGLTCPGVVIGRWPTAPDLADRCSLTDLPKDVGAPLLGAVPDGAVTQPPEGFRSAAPGWLHRRWAATGTRQPSPPVSRPEPPPGAPASNGVGRPGRYERGLHP